MTATGRSPVRDPRDFYQTPAWSVQAIKPHLQLEQFSQVIDPGCGSGAIGDALETSLPIIGVEMDPDLARYARHTRTYVQVIEANYLDPEKVLLTKPTKNRLVIGNPPYKHALEFVQRSLWLAGLEGTVAFLLRLNWLEGQKRRDWHRSHPCDVYVHSRRPSFTGKGTDACAYAWFVWRPGPAGRVTIL